MKLVICPRRETPKAPVVPNRSVPSMGARSRRGNCIFAPKEAASAWWTLILQSTSARDGSTPDFPIYTSRAAGSESIQALARRCNCLKVPTHSTQPASRSDPMLKRYVGRGNPFDPCRQSVPRSRLHPGAKTSSP